MSDRQDKPFDPTPRRIKKAREEGNVFRSQEINSVAMLSLAILLLGLGGRAGAELLSGVFARSFAAASSVPLTVRSVQPILIENAAVLSVGLVPLFLLFLAAGVSLSVAQTGWNITAKPLQPKLERISPLKGLKRILSSKGLFAAAKSFAKIIAVGPVAYLFISRRIPEILQLHTLSVESLLLQISEWVILLGGQILAVLMILSGADFAFEKWRYKQDLKMDIKELKDEAKENEGDPQLRVRRRQFARQLTKPRLDHAVMKSDVVVTNPTHYAVALRYDPTEADAPRVMAKGIRKRALRIRELALEFDVPIVENKPLARALYRGVNELDEIPEELYAAMAAVLAEIYRGRGRDAA